MVFVKKGVVIPLGGTDEFDIARTQGSDVLHHNGRFYLYYTGYDGSKWRIGLAISEDGLTFVKKGVVIPLGGTDEFDIDGMQDPDVLYHNGRFYLYYTGYDGSKWRIGLGISEDGLTFVKKGVVIPLGGTGELDVGNTHGPGVLHHNGRFYLYYTGYDGSKWRIGLAISEDGLTFVKKGVVIPLGGTDEFDDGNIQESTVLCHNGRFYLYYTGYDGSKWRIGLAISEDGLTFVKKGVVIPLGGTDGFDIDRIQDPAILYHNGRFYLYYTGYDGSKWRIGLAISEDGL